MRKRKLLVVAVLFSAAPVSALLASPEGGQHESDCPYERAAAEAASPGQTTVTIESSVPEGSVLSGRDSPSAFLP